MNCEPQDVCLVRRVRSHRHSPSLALFSTEAAVTSDWTFWPESVMTIILVWKLLLIRVLHCTVELDWVENVRAVCVMVISLDVQMRRREEGSEACNQNQKTFKTRWESSLQSREWVWDYGDLSLANTSIAQANQAAAMNVQVRDFLSCSYDSLLKNPHPIPKAKVFEIQNFVPTYRRKLSFCDQKFFIFLSKIDSLWRPWFWCRFLFIFFVFVLCFNYTSSQSYSHSSIKSQSSIGGMIRTAPWLNYDNLVLKVLEGQVNLIILKLWTSTT